MVYCIEYTKYVSILFAKNIDITSSGENIGHHKDINE